MSEFEKCRGSAQIVPLGRQVNGPGSIPVECILAKGHEGDHVARIEWPRG